MKISYLKSSQNLLFSSYTNKYRSDPSKKLVLGPVGQRAAKMWAFKVCTVRDSNPGRSESNDSLCNVASNPKGLEIFLTANFDSP